MTKQLAPIHRLSLLLIASLFAAVGCQWPSSEPNPKNELPFGTVEAPPQGAGVDRQMTVGGWALDDEGVKEVRVFVDNRFVGRTPVDQPRPDVTKSFPAYTAGKDLHGWVLKVSLGSAFAAGSHTILAQAVDTQGATRDIGTVNISLAPAP